MDESMSVTAPPDRSGQSDRTTRMADLLDAARGGSEEALGQITAELSPMLWHVARAAGLGRAAGPRAEPCTAAGKRGGSGPHGGRDRSRRFR